VSATWLLVRLRSGSAMLAWLQLTAGGVSTLLAFAVAMLATAFWQAPSEDGGYRVLAVALAGLLLVPLVTLGTAAARLAARSRDDRLATLRLLGASAGRVRRIAVAETTLVAAAGVLAGTLASAALPFALSLLTVHGNRLSPAELLPPLPLTTAVPALLVVIAAGSALLGLRRVTLSPLGVRTRSEAPRMSPLRLLAGAVAIGGAVAVSQLASPGWGVTGIVVALTIAVLAVMAVLGVVGPFVLSILARGRASGTSDASALVAARGILDDPKAAWRQVSAVALTSFVLVPAGSMLGYLHTIRNSASAAIMTADQLLLFDDARTMLIALAAVSFLVTGCQIAITQTAAVRERRDLYIALDRIGMPFSAIERARRTRVTGPAVVAVVGAALAATALAFFLVFIAIATSPLFFAGTVALLGGGVLLIRAGVAASTPVLRGVLAAPQRGE
jgi:hypothetical protein